VIAKTIFADTAFSADIFKLFQSRVLSAFSIGFMPTEGGPPEEKEILENPTWAKAQWVIRKWELFEYSAVAVPANPEALALAVSKGLNITAETMDRLGVADPRRRRSILMPGVSDVLSREKPDIGTKIFIFGE
jgi:phage head maturation protease